MKTIDGKNIYVSLGFADRKKIEGDQLPDINEITHTYFNGETVKDSIVYIDDRDPENIIMIPLIPINDIQMKDGQYKFTIIVNGNKLKFNEGEFVKRINIVGLFCEYIKDNKQYVKPISFFKVSGMYTIFTKNYTASYSMGLDINEVKEAIKNA